MISLSFESVLFRLVELLGKVTNSFCIGQEGWIKYERMSVLHKKLKIYLDPRDVPELSCFGEAQIRCSV